MVPSPLTGSNSYEARIVVLAGGQPRVNHLCLRFDRTYMWQAAANAFLPATNNNIKSTLTQLQTCGKQMSHTPEGTRGKSRDGKM